MVEETDKAVLIPTPIAPPGVACVRSFGRRGIKTIVASERKTDPAFASRYCDEAVMIPSPHEDLLAYKDALLSLAARPSVRAITPNREEDAYIFSKYRAEFEEYVTPVWPSFETLRTVHDRMRLSEAAAEAGVPAPATWLLDDIDDWDRELIVKPRYPILVEGYVDSYSPTECDSIHTVKYLPPGVEPDREVIRAEMLGHTPIVQELVPKSDEYMIAALYDRGEPVTMFHHHQIRGHSYTGGGSVYRKSVHIPQLEAVARKLLDHLDWHGLACIEYMKDAETGEYKLTEINPRFWRSLPFTVRTGADFPYYYWCLAQNDTHRIDSEYDLDITSHFLYGEAQYIKSVLQYDDLIPIERPTFQAAIWDVMSSCLKEPHFDYLQLDDLGPFVRGLRNTVLARR